MTDQTFTSLIPKLKRVHVFLLLAIIAVSMIIGASLFSAPYNEKFINLTKTKLDNRNVTIHKQKLILFAFIALGPVQLRNSIIHGNLKAFEGADKYSHKYKVDCIIFSYGAKKIEPQWVLDMQKEENPICSFVPAYQLTFVHFCKFLIPSVLKTTGSELL